MLGIEIFSTVLRRQRRDPKHKKEPDDTYECIDIYVNRKSLAVIATWFHIIGELYLG